MLCFTCEAVLISVFCKPREPNHAIIRQDRQIFLLPSRVLFSSDLVDKGLLHKW